ncbi:MAG TPA: hypothetical protein VHY84_09315 [Bryobacteraceae bacterium]|jgi:hypothetical protein|nr:hypothetical protein [Bryobacteraceae bacterium]
MSTGESRVELYIDPAVLTGEPDANSWVDHSPDWRNQHAIWEHANQTISKPSPSQQDLSTAVIQLQRSVEHRDKLLDHLYSFEKIPGRRPGSKYETMADLKIIRPTLKIRLRDLRNRLMHEFDEIPLNVSDCEELADTAWYYLKATDHLAHQCISDFDVRSSLASGKQAHLTITFKCSDWTAWINADVPDEALQGIATEKNLIIQATPSEVQKKDSRTRISGTASGSPQALNPLVHMFFDESALR